MSVLASPRSAPSRPCNDVLVNNLPVGQPTIVVRRSKTVRGEYRDESVEVHRDAIFPGDSVLLIDDVIAMGGIMRAGCHLVEQRGGTGTRCAVVIQLLVLGSPQRLADDDVVRLIQY